MNGSPQLGARVVDALTSGPRSTGRLLALLDLDETVGTVAELHRVARSYGFGQCADGLWRTASDSDEVRAVIVDDRPTPSAEAFFMLQHTPFGALAVHNPYAARSALEEINTQAAAQIAAVDARLSRAVEVLREQGMSVQEIEQIVFSDEVADSAEIDVLSLRQAGFVAKLTENRRRMLKRRAVHQAHEEGLSVRKIAARTGIPPTEVFRILQDLARRPPAKDDQGSS